MRGAAHAQLALDGAVTGRGRPRRAVAYGVITASHASRAAFGRGNADDVAKRPLVLHDEVCKRVLVQLVAKRTTRRVLDVPGL